MGRTGLVYVVARSVRWPADDGLVETPDDGACHSVPDYGSGSSVLDSRPLCPKHHPDHHPGNQASVLIAILRVPWNIRQAMSALSVNGLWMADQCLDVRPSRPDRPDCG